MTPTQTTTQTDWLGRLVHVLVVFRLLILLVTLALVLPYRYSSEMATGVLLVAGLSYLPLRHWTIVCRTPQRRRIYVVAELVVSLAVLGLAGSRSSLFFCTLGTAVLVGAVCSVRPAAAAAAALAGGYVLITVAGLPTMHVVTTAQTLVLAALYPVAICAGLGARAVIDRGACTEELLHARNRALAVERERLAVARELHDSLAKTVEGLAMTATALPRRCVRDPEAAALLASELAADARRAALEARALMGGLRSDGEANLLTQLKARADALSARSGVEMSFFCLDELAVASLPGDVQHELLRIFGEAAINAVNHGGATHVRVVIAPSMTSDGLTMTVTDDGCGLDGPVDLQALRDRGHYGLVGMSERAASFGGEVEYRHAPEGGVMINVAVPAMMAAPVPADREAMEVIA